MTNRKEIYFEKLIPCHIIIRAIEGKEIFLKEEDILRFIFQSYVANIGRSISNIRRQDIKKIALAILNGEKIPRNLIVVEHKPLVYSLSFVFVVTHYHDVLIQNIEGGISKYLQKRNTGFAKYYNAKYGRRANLFERPPKIVPIKTDFQLDAILRYVNIKNPLDVFQPGWQDKGLKDIEGAYKFLNEYQFSSFPDLFGKRESNILAPRDVLEKYLGKEVIVNRDNHKRNLLKFVKSYLEEYKEEMVKVTL